MKRRLLRTVLWRRLDRPGLEHFRLLHVTAQRVGVSERQDRRGREPIRFAQADDGHLLQGTVILPVDDAPAEIRYRVVCSGWVTESVHVELERGSGARMLDLAVDEDRRWRVDDALLPALDGLLDVDLGWTPSTNTLPIRRLDLGVGQHRDVTAAWVRFPDLAIEPLRQRYTRLGERTYRYENQQSGFSAELEVDDLGLVTSYEGGWERVAESGEGG